MKIVLERLQGETSIAELCRREGMHPNLYYPQGRQMEQRIPRSSKQRLAGDIRHKADSHEVNEMRNEIEQLKQLVAELSLKIAC